MKTTQIFTDRLRQRARNIFAWCLVSSAWCLICLSVYGQTTSIKNLFVQSNKFDGKIVEAEGEVIGEALKDKDKVWINISCAGSAIGVFLSDENLLKEIKYWGSYRQKGDIVKIRGRFYKNCPFHQKIDIHAQGVKVSKRGFPRKEFVSSFKIKLAIVFFIICLTLTSIYFIKLWRRK